MKKILKGLDSNIYMAVFAVFLINIGSKYMLIDVPHGLEQLLKHIYVRRLVLFSIFFVATKNTVLSITLTILFAILSNTVFNEQSKYCLLSKNVKQATITEIEYKKALEVVNKYKQQQNQDDTLNKHEDKLKNNYVKIKEAVINIKD
jgi:hypothetical protein